MTIRTRCAGFEHPPIDTNLDRRGRFRKAMELLQRARADIAAEEDDPQRDWLARPRLPAY